MSIEHVEETRILLTEEQVEIGRRQVETDRVRIRTVIDEVDLVLVEHLDRGLVDIERLTVDREVDAAPPPRHEGDVLVISIVEERAIVQKRMFVVEELRLRQTSQARPVEIPTTVRRMRAEIDRSPTLPDADPADRAIDAPAGADHATFFATQQGASE